MEIIFDDRYEFRRYATILLVPVLILAGSTSLLLKDYWSDYIGSEGHDQIGLLKSSTGDVKRRSSERFRWDSVRTNQPLFLKDSVRTTVGAHAIINLGEESEIEVGENSLIVLEKTKNKISIDFLAGQISFHGGVAGLRVKVKDRIVEAKEAAGNLLLQKGNVLMNVITGSVHLQDQENVIRQITREEQVKFSEANPLEVVVIRAELLNPPQGAFFLVEDQVLGHSNIHFDWKLTDKIDSPQLQVSQTSDFAAASRVPLADTMHGHQSFPLGIYFWRIVSKEKPISEVRNFEVLDRLPIRLIDPPDGDVKTMSDDSEFLFRWVGSPRFQRYSLQIATDRGFKVVTHSSEIIGQTQALVKLDRSGQYFWKVNGVATQALLNESSTIRTFTIKEKKNGGQLSSLTESNLIPTKQIFPLLDADLSLLDFGKLPELLVKFQWSAAPELSQIQLIISKLKNDHLENYEEVLRTQVAMSHMIGEYQWIAKTPGKYQWELRKIGLVGSSSGEASLSQFTIRKEFRGIDHVLAEVVEDQRQKKMNLKISWSPFFQASRYKVSIFGSASQSAPLEEIETKQLNWNTERQEYFNHPIFYQISAELASGFKVLSNIERFEFVPRKVLKKDPSPKLTSRPPVSKKLISIENVVSDVNGYTTRVGDQIQKKFNLKISWSPCPKAKRYKISIFQSSDQKVLLEEAYTNRLDWTTARQEYFKNSIFYKISAELGPEIQASSQVQQFQYQSQSQSALSQMIQPLDLASISKVQKNQAKINFLLMTWSRGEEGTRYEIEIARDKNFSQILFNSAVEENFLMVPLKDLSLGHYWWRLRMISPGRVRFTNLPRTFEILP